MIFVTNAEGGVTYVSPEWCTFTGQAAPTAAGLGWLASVHPKDRDAALDFLRGARDRQSEFSVRHRLRRADGSFAWVVVGAVPSFGPPGRTFLGFLGSLTEISPSGSEPLTAYGAISHFVPPPAHPATPPGTPLELVADHLLMAHGLIEEDGAKEMLRVLRQALMVAGVLLARNVTSGDAGNRFH